jgi:hypothetical protein
LIYQIRGVVNVNLINKETVNVVVMENRREAVEKIEQYNQWLATEKLTDDQRLNLKEMIEVLNLIVEQYNNILKLN